MGIFYFFHENIIFDLLWNHHLIALLPLMSINTACSYRRKKATRNANLSVIFLLAELMAVAHTSD